MFSIWKIPSVRCWRLELSYACEPLADSDRAMNFSTANCGATKCIVLASPYWIQIEPTGEVVTLANLQYRVFQLRHRN